MGLLAVYVAFGQCAYPVPTGDSMCHMPVAVGYAKSGELTNPLWDFAVRYDQANKARFLQYPPLFHMVTGLLALHATPHEALMVVAAMNVVSLGLGFWLFLLAARSGRDLNWFSFALVAAGLFGISTHLSFHGAGRPEALATPFILVGAIGALRMRSIPLWPFLGAVLGLVGATQPAGGIILFLIISLFYFATTEAKGAFFTLAAVGALGIAVFLGAVSLSPHNLRDTIAGIQYHASHVLPSAGPASLWNILPYGFWHFWFFCPNTTFYGLIGAIALAAGLHLWWTNRVRIRAPLLFAVAGVLLLSAVWYFGIRWSNRNYCVIMFFPLLYAGIIYYVVVLGKAQRGWLLCLGRYVCLLSLMLSSVGFLRAGILFPYFLRAGVGLDESKAMFNRFVVAHPGRTGITCGLWLLPENYAGIWFWEGIPGRQEEDAAGSTMVIQQNDSSRTTPPDVKGHVLVYNSFVCDAPRILGMRLASSVPGYGMAIYLPQR